MRKVTACVFAVSLLVPLLSHANRAQSEKEKPGPKDKEAYEAAYKEGRKRFDEACKTAGRTVPPATQRVPGIRLEVPAGALSFEQGSIDRDWAFAGMPHERMGDRFIASFLDFNFGDSDLHPEFGARTGMTVTMTGFPAVDVRQKDGTYLRYRLKGKTPSEGMTTEPVPRDRAFKHVVRIEPLKTAAERQHWVGGTRVSVIDSGNGKVMGELRAVSFAEPPAGVKASELDKRTWGHSTSCPKYLDIQSAMARISLIGIIDPIDRFERPAEAVPPVTASLNEAVAKKVLREATWADVDAWRAAAGLPKSTSMRVGGPHRTYVVLKAFALPDGMSGAHSAKFYVPKGVPLPTGKLAHSTVYDFNTMSCDGVGC